MIENSYKFSFARNFSVFFMILILNGLTAQSFLTPFEKGNGNQTTTYAEMQDFYKDLDQKYASVSIKTMGTTDSGESLQLVLFNSNLNFNPEKFGKKAVLLINNGIHPGEPDGIDASMQLVRDMATGKIKTAQNVVVAVIQAYNIGGMLNRGKFSRANQNGPEEYGFRGNARNFDLNRDFIKADSKNAAAFQEIIHWLNPDYFIDNHVSNGADYPYTFTYITTNRERLGRSLGAYLHTQVAPEIRKSMLAKNIMSIPYVEINGLKPEKGYEAFMDTPRYATGYTSLFNILGEVPETHMLKPYSDRVKATYENMLSTIEFLDKNFAEVKKQRVENMKQFKPGNRYALQWKLDSTRYQTMEFKGYEAGLKPSEVSGQPRLYYDRAKPYTKEIPFYNTYLPVKRTVIPNFYVIPKSEWQVLEHLKRNRIVTEALKRDTVILVESYKIASYKTSTRPYEGHYLHYDTEVEKQLQHKTFQKGDFLISLNQPGVKYLLETLEPEATDSFFNWNLFDSFLGQKEYFSDYVFEDTAAQLLNENPGLQKQLEAKKAADPKFAADGRAQLDWVYKNSPYYEKSHMRYPIYRIP